jgi:hypothetical protein
MKKLLIALCFTATMIMADQLSMEWDFKAKELDTEEEQLDAGLMMVEVFGDEQTYPTIPVTNFYPLYTNWDGKVETNVWIESNRSMTTNEKAFFMVDSFMEKNAITNELGEITDYSGSRVETYGGEYSTCGPILKKRWTVDKIKEYRKKYKLENVDIKLKRNGENVTE